jgi:hypothetical protein
MKNKLFCIHQPKGGMVMGIFKAGRLFCTVVLIAFFVTLMGCASTGQLKAVDEKAQMALDKANAAMNAANNAQAAAEEARATSMQAAEAAAMRAERAADAAEGAASRCEALARKCEQAFSKAMRK